MKKLIIILCLLSSKLSAQIKDDTTIYSIVEIMPEFPGGDDALMTFLSKNFLYPIDSTKNENEICGTFLINFIVRKNGLITDLNVLDCNKNKCFQVANKILKNMPKWKAGKQNGKYVDCSFDIPLNISLEN